MASGSFAPECGTLGFINAPTTGRNTILANLTVCGPLSVDTLFANEIHGITQDIAGTAVLTASSYIVNNANVITGPEVQWIQIGNGLIVEVKWGLQTIATAVVTANIIVTPTGPLADLYVVSGSPAALAQNTLRGHGVVRQTPSGSNAAVYWNVLPPINTVSAGNTVIQAVLVTGAVANYVNLAGNFKYDTQTSFP